MSENQLEGLLRRNCSTMFLLYPLGLSVRNLEGFGFVEAYLKDEYCQTDYETPVFLLFKPDDKELLQLFIDGEYLRENTFTNTFDLQEDYNRGDGEVVLVYDFPFKRDYKIFLNSKYSRFSEKMINTYPKMVPAPTGGMKIVGTQYRIITKDKDTVNLLVKEYGQGFLTDQNIPTIASMLEDMYGTPFDDSMELWKAVNMEKETLKYVQ